MKLLALFLILLVAFPIVADATAVSVTIHGTTKSNAQANVTCYGCNNTISVQAWNTSYVKNFTVNTPNASGDVISFNISNVTAYQVQELKVNGTSINAYQAGANGMLNFSYNVIGNKTLVLSPAVNAGGYNSTWSWFWNLTAKDKMYVSGSNTEFTISDSVNTNVPKLIFDKPAGGGATDWSIESGISGVNNGALTIKNILTGMDVLVLIPGGNGGVGTTAPREKWEVAGNMKITGGIIFADGTNLSTKGVTITEQNSVGMSCSTVYQNTNTSAIFVNAQLQLVNTSVTTTFYTDASNPPTTATARLYMTGGTNPLTVSSWVLKDNYYYWTNTNCGMLGTVIWK